MLRSLIVGWTMLCLTGCHPIVRSSQAAAAPARPAPPQPVQVFPNPDHATESLCFSPDGQRLAINSGKRIRLWTIRSGQCRRRFEITSEQMAFSPDSRLLAAVTGSHRVTLWDTTHGRVRRVLAVRFREIAALAFSPDGRTLAVADSEANRVLLYDTHTWRMKRLLRAGAGDAPDPLRREAINTLKFSPDGRLLATVHESGSRTEAHSVWGWVNVWDTSNWRVRRKLEPEVNGPYFLLDEIDFSPTSHVLVGVATGVGGTSQMTRWELDSGKAQRLGTELVGQCTALTFTADGSTLVAGIPETGVWLFDAQHPDTDYRVPTLTARLAVPPLSVSPDGRLLATADAGGKVKLWDVASLLPHSRARARLVAAGIPR
jgi:WD40 repeat protein